MLSKTDQQEIVVRSETESMADLAREHGVSRQHVHALVKAANAHVTEIELELLRATYDGEYPTLVIPYGPDYTTAVAYFYYIVERLEARKVKTRVTKRAVPNGVVFMLEEVRPNKKEST